MYDWIKIAFGCAVVAALLLLCAFLGYLFADKEEITIVAQISVFVGIFAFVCALLGLKEKTE